MPSGQCKLIFESKNTEQFINYLLKYLEYLKGGENGQKYTGLIEIAETKAWAMERLSSKIRHVFYPEAVELRDQYRARYA